MGREQKNKLRDFIEQDSTTKQLNKKEKPKRYQTTGAKSKTKRKAEVAAFKFRKAVIQKKESN